MPSSRLKLVFLLILPLILLSLALHQAFSADNVWVNLLLPEVKGNPVVLFLLQFISILLISRLCGLLFRKLKQPQVLGEMLAGIVLGPSILGYVSLELHQSLFPSASLAGLQGISQIGLMLFMFMIGLELDIKALQQQRGHAAIISYMSIVTPFALGSVLALYLYDLAQVGVPRIVFVLFFGTAMSVTAMPVLARILSERRQLSSPIGSLAMSCAAVNDVSAWIILALIVWLARNGTEGPWQSLQLVGYIGLMFFMMKPLLQRYLGRFFTGAVSQDRIALVLGFALISALATEIIGVHALFGAFVAGVIMPRQREFIDSLVHKISDITLVLLLPIFFAWSGLRTNIGLLTQPQDWLTAILILLVAIVGKLVGTYLAARYCGMKKQEAKILGVLMNTRGLMELVILNIGFDIGIISQKLFTIMAFMAIITTMMTAPLLNLWWPPSTSKN